VTTHDTPGEIGDPRAATPRELQRMLEFERRGAPFLAYRNGNGDLELLDLAERTRVIVGREPPAQVLINWDLQVSRLHCVLAQVGAQWTVEDDGLSRNGTYLNGSRIAQRAILRAGDHLRVGRTAIQFQAPVTGAVSSTEVASDIVSAAELTPTQHQVLVALCRPLFGDRSTPATNPEIAAEVFLGVDAVKVHMRALFRKFDLEDLAQNEKRGRLAERAMRLGLVAERDL
jgi:pSer/pThr/pTyr-binding forkhead associated (FHA) protein